MVRVVATLARSTCRWRVPSARGRADATVRSLAGSLRFSVVPGKDTFIRIGQISLNWVQLQGDIVGAASRRSQSTKASAANVWIGLPMIKHYTEGLLFYDRAQERRIVAYDVSRTDAQVHADGLGLLPIHFYITLDNFLTVGKCRLLWRHGDDIGIAFERWIDVPQRIANDQAGVRNCGNYRER